MPCFTAFSTSVCSSIAGTCVPAIDGTGLDREREPAAEAGLLDVEVGLRKRELLIERRPFLLRSPQRVAKHLRQLLDGGVGSRRVGVNQRRDGVQRVEEEVRIDLRAQRFELGAARLQAQFLRDLILFLPPALQPHVLEHEPEHAGERAQQREVLAEQRARLGCWRSTATRSGVPPAARTTDPMTASIVAPSGAG